MEYNCLFFKETESRKAGRLLEREMTFDFKNM